MQINLANITILLTGASDGIGKALAEQLMASGARVALHYNKNKDSAEALAKRFFETKSAAFQADLNDLTQTKLLFEEVESAFSKIDVIVHNAGVFLQHDISQNLDEWMETWQRTLTINLTSVGLLTKLGIEHFRKNGGGRFVYIASRAAFRGETQEYLAYAASKGGMLSLARSVARSFGKDNIKAFSVAPGFTRTAMAEQFIADYGEDRMLSEIALPKLTEPNDIAPLVTLLCSGLMDHATGSTLDVNAGSHIR